MSTGPAPAETVLPTGADTPFTELAEPLPAAEKVDGALPCTQDIISWFSSLVAQVIDAIPPSWLSAAFPTAIALLGTLIVTYIAAKQGGLAGYRAAQRDSVRREVEDELQFLNIAVAYVQTISSHFQAFARTDWSERFATYSRQRSEILALRRLHQPYAPPSPPFPRHEFCFKPFLDEVVPVQALERYVVERTTIPPWGVDAALRVIRAEHQIRVCVAHLNAYNEDLTTRKFDREWHRYIAYATEKGYLDLMRGIDVALNNIFFYLLHLEEALSERTRALCQSHKEFLASELTYTGRLETSPIKKLVKVTPQQRAWMASWGLSEEF